MAVITRLRQLLLPALAALALVHGVGVAATTLPPTMPQVVGVLDQTWSDSVRKRDIPVRIYYPKITHSAATPCPVIIFSHGLGGSREGYAYLGDHWARHGYIVVHLQHPGSDQELLGAFRPLKALREAMTNPQVALDRPRDVSFAITQLTALNADPAFFLHGRMDLDRLGVAGHSFGAFTTMAIAGADLPVLGGARSFSDPRVRAAIAMSTPRTPDEDEIFDRIAVPVFHFTGTKDESRSSRAHEDNDLVVGATSAEERVRPYRRTRHARAYLLVLEGGDHQVFSGRLGTSRPSDQAFQELVKTGSTVFWDAWLKGDETAKAYLEAGEFAATVGRLGTFEWKTPSP